MVSENNASSLDMDNNPPSQLPSDDETSKNYTSIQFINRVMNYPTVNSWFETAKGYYSTAKQSNYYVKKGCETVESNIDQTMKYVVNPVLNNGLVQNLSEPVIHTVDGIACKQLDRIEKLQPQVNAISEDIKERMKDLPQKIEPIDQYLKNSVLAKPLNIAVGVSENLCDRFIPEKKLIEATSESLDDVDTNESNPTEAKSKEIKASPGPIFRSSKVAKRLQREAFSKLSNLTLRDDETRKSFDYVVDLIQYAAKNLDAGVESTSKLFSDSFHKGLEMSKETVPKIKESIPKIKESIPKIKESTQEHIQHLTQEALDSLIKAIDILSKQIPEPITSSSNNLIERTKTLAKLLETSNMQVYHSIATTSAKKLHETSQMITSALKSAETIPINIIQITANTLTSILDNFIGHRDWTSLSIMNHINGNNNNNSNGNNTPTAMKSS